MAESTQWAFPLAAQPASADVAFDLKAAAGPKGEVLVIPGERRVRGYRDGKPQYESAHGHAYRDGQAQYEHAVAGILEQVAAR